MQAETSVRTGYAPEGYDATQPASDLAVCLMPLLQALGWQGQPRHVAEAMPHFMDCMDLTDLRNVLAILGYASHRLPLRRRALDPRLLPCLYLPDDGAALVLLRAEGEQIEVFDSYAGKRRLIPNRRLRGDVFCFREVEAEDAALPLNARWFRQVLGRYWPLFLQAFALTLCINLLGLATPLFSMAVYDKVVQVQAPFLLLQLGLGVAIAMIAEFGLRQLRANVLAFIGARLSGIVGDSVFARILALPISFTERASVGSQVARIKDFDTIREFFTGSMLMLVFELPFTLLFLIITAALGGVMALVPLGMLALFALLGWIVFPIIRRNVAAAAQAGSRRQEFVIETVGKLRALKLAGAGTIWLERFREISACAVFAGYRTARMTAILQSVSQSLATIVGVVTMIVGVDQVLAEKLSTGGLIATMMLIWRCLSPLQMAFMSFTRLEQVRNSVRQIDGLMGLKPEREPSARSSAITPFKGKVGFLRASLRYSSDADPALMGITFEARPGELVCITGWNGSGKSSILKLIAGLYPLQGGSVRIDDVDIRQLDPVELRHAVGYVPQHCHFFYGTIAQNLLLARPLATEAELVEACIDAGVWRQIEALPDGLRTRLGDFRIEGMAASFLQKIALARALLKRSRILLLDEPVNGLDFEADQAFMEMLARLRGTTTIFLVTHRPSHLRMADRVLVLESGTLRFSGPPDDILRNLPEGFL